MSAKQKPKKLQTDKLGTHTIIHQPGSDHPIFKQSMIVGCGTGLKHAILLMKLHREASAEGKADHTVRFAEVRLFAFLWYRHVGLDRIEKIRAYGLDCWPEWKEIEDRLATPEDLDEFRRLLDDACKQRDAFRARSVSAAENGENPESARAPVIAAQSVTTRAEPDYSTPSEVNPNQPV